MAHQAEHYLEGFDGMEIAALLGIPEGTEYSRIRLGGQPARRAGRVPQVRRDRAPRTCAASWPASASSAGRRRRPRPRSRVRRGCAPRNLRGERAERRELAARRAGPLCELAGRRKLGEDLAGRREFRETVLRETCAAGWAASWLCSAGLPGAACSARTGAANPARPQARRAGRVPQQCGVTAPPRRPGGLRSGLPLAVSHLSRRLLSPPLTGPLTVRGPHQLRRERCQTPLEHAFRAGLPVCHVSQTKC